MRTKYSVFRRNTAGSALLLILGCVALLTILVIAFFVTSRTEFSSSSFYAKGVSTKLLSENVINLVEAQLREGARSTDITASPTIPVAWASQPGMIRTYDNAGNPHKYFKLYSWDNMIGTGQFISTATTEVPPPGSSGWESMPNVFTDLNQPVNGIYPIIDPGAQGSVEGFSYTAQNDAINTNPLSMPVKWLYIMKNGATSVGTPTGTGTAVTIAGATLANPVIGRVAFWTDDETCKVNINTASEGIFWDQPYGQSTNEMGIHDNNANPPFGFADSIPNGNEFARIPGHPATTSLSAVFGYGTNPVLPDTSFNPADANANIWPLTPTAYASNFAPYFSLSPRYEAGGTQGGSVQNYPQVFTLPSYRLYDSIDELAYDPARTLVTSAASSSPPLYPAANGAIPAGRTTLSKVTPAIIEQRRFFLTAHSRAPEETLFGTPRISLWPLQDSTQALKVNTAKDNLLAFCSTINNQPYYFQRVGYYQYQQNSGYPVLSSPTAVPSALSATEDFPGAPTSTLQTGVPRNENLYAYLQALTSNDIPGFGGNFLSKYPGGSDGNGLLVTDRDEILTEMFDFIRAGVNTFNISPNVLPHYTYTPWSANMVDNPYNNPQDTGETIPINIPSNGTHGLGRTYNFDEISLVLFAQAMDINGGPDPTTGVVAQPAVAAGTPDPGNSNRMSIGPGLPWAVAIDNNSLFTVPPYQKTPALPTGPKWLYWDTANPGRYGAYMYETSNTETGSPALVPIDPTTNLPQVDKSGLYVSLPATAVTIADPQTTYVQAYLLLRPHTVLQGQPVVSPDIRVRVSYLDQLALTFDGSTSQAMNFPSEPNAVVMFNSNNSASTESSGGILSPFNVQQPSDSWSNGISGVVTAANGTPSTEGAFFNDGTRPTYDVYPLVSIPVKIPTGPAYPSPYGGEDTSGLPQPSVINPPAPVQIHSLAPPSSPDTLMTINGQTLRFDVFDSVSDLKSASTLPLQTFYVKIPSMTLPIPTIEMANQEGECLGGAGYGGPLNTGNNIVGPRIPGFVNTNASANPADPPTQVPFQVPSGTPPGSPAPLYGTFAVTPLGYPGLLYNNTTYPAGPVGSPEEAPNPEPGVLQPLNYYWQLPWDCRSISQRLSTWWSQNYGRQTVWATADRLICRGDVVRSFVPNPTPGSIDGDIRLLMANPIRPSVTGASPILASDDYVPVGDGRSTGFYSQFPTQGPYTNRYIRQLHAQTFQSGSTRTTLDLIPTSQFILTQPTGADSENVPWGPIGHLTPTSGGIGDTSGQLYPNEEYAYMTAPNVTPELQGAFMDAASQIPGDWTLGQGPMMDGPTVQKPDESIQTPPSSTVFPYYNMGYGPPNTYNLSYSPNREIPSPIVFGSLPSRAMQGIPWCTLLFCPNPASNDNGSVSPTRIHPGFGVSSSTGVATNLPSYFSPPYAQPPDHLFLDLFWMPVVEPYAISEPFSTAGKVNMNYAIVPFGGYIHRSTALHAVMKSQQLVAVPTKFNNLNFLPMTATDPPDATNFSGTEPNFKAFGFWYEDSTWGYWGSTYNYITRYGINLPATIDDFASTTYTPNSTNGNAFYDRFDVQNDIFRSASEICNVFLVPQPLNLATGQTLNLSYSPAAMAVPTDASYNSMQAWWANFAQTGDNGREDPYNELYPRLTTKSNSFDVNMRVQVIVQTPADRASGTFNPAAGDSIAGEYRGSAVVERYLDPNQTNPPLPDFATTFPGSPTGATSTVDNYVRYRVVGSHAFSP